MTATPHILAGAVIGKVLRRPWLAWPVAFVSHFLLDFIPHLDSHAIYGVEQGGPTAPEAALGILNFTFGAVLIVWLVRRQPDRRVVLGGALFGILIDLIENIPLLGASFRTWPGTAWLSVFHHSFHHNVTPAQWPLGIATQLVVVAIALWFCLPRKHKDLQRSTENT